MLKPDSIVTWKWTPPDGYRSKYGPETVNTLFAMVRRHYARTCPFICVTDDADGLHPSITVVPDRADYGHLPSPAGRKHPSCYRRLRAFDPTFVEVAGSRFVSLDLDMLFVSDLTSVWERDEDFVIYGDTNPRTYYNGSMFLMSTGARSKVWTDFHPVKSPRFAYEAGHHGSDQGWISYCLGPSEVKWTKADGVYSFRNHLEKKPQWFPENARVVCFHGSTDPWSADRQRYPWIGKHYVGLNESVAA